MPRALVLIYPLSSYHNL